MSSSMFREAWTGVLQTSWDTHDASRQQSATSGCAPPIPLLASPSQMEFVNISAPLRGRGAYPRLFGFFGALAPAWKTDLSAALRSLAAGHRPRGLVIVVSDLLSPGTHDGLHALIERGYEAVVAHVIDPSEVDPDLEGDLDLYDRETGEVVRIAADASLGARYRERVASWISEQEALCARRQIRYMPVNTTVSVEDFLFHDARARRIVA